MAEIIPRPWRFTQLGGGGKVLDLSGYAAPFGRPRKSPVIEKEREVRQSKRYYPGNRVPSRHIFGDKHNEFTLVGRFMDSRLGGDGAARAKADEVDAFVGDQIPCRGEWGGIVVFTGMLLKLRLSYESEQEIAWTLTGDIDTDDTKTARAPTPPTDGAAQLLQQVLDDLAASTAFVDPSSIPQDIEFQPSFLDGIKNVISTINSVTGSIKGFAESVDNFESNLYSTVESLRAGVHQLQQAADQLRITLDSGVNDAHLEAADARSQVDWFKRRADAEYLLLGVLALLADIERSAENAQNGVPDKTVRARGGDTWESLAIQYMGSASKADSLRQANALRQANGAKYGAQPTPGQIVHIPKV